MAHYKLDTNMAGAFMNVYMPIGADPVVKDLQGDADLYEDRAYVLRACEYCRNTDNPRESLSIDDMMLEADRYLTKFRQKLKFQRIMEEQIKCKDCACCDKDCMFCDKLRISVHEHDIACPEFEERDIVHCSRCDCEIDVDRDDFHYHDGMYLCDCCYDELYD